MQIKKYTTEKIEYIAELIEDVYEREHFTSMIEDTKAHAYVAYESDCMVGVCLADIDERDAYLYLYISEKYRNQGVGSALLKEMENHLRGLNVLRVNMDCINSDHNKEFFKKKNYLLDFTSEIMLYHGARKTVSKYEVRGYNDEDYLPTRTIIRDAFHNMQVKVGLEAEDYVYPPNEEERSDYEENKEDIFLLIDRDSIVGVLRFDGDEIDDLAVAPNEQRKGYGTHLIHYAINKLLDDFENETIKLWCIVGNSAREFYLKEGFVSYRVHDIMYKNLT